jgi:ribosomal protein L7/L12
MDSRISPQQLEAIRQAALADHKIEAIKLYREATGAGLAEAKRAVEELEEQWRSGLSSPDVTMPGPGAGPGNIPTPLQLDQIRRAACDGDKIQAIKLYREATGLGLAEAKQAVERLELQWRRETPASPAPAAAAPGPSKPFARRATGSGCLGLLLLLAGGGLVVVAEWLRRF